MLRRLSLRNASLAAEIVPDVGGGLARLDWLRGGAATPLLRGLPDATDTPLPGQLACFPLVPWSNRMAPSGFAFDGAQYVAAPNRAGEPCPIHGDGWQQAWTVQSHTHDSVVLTLERADFSPLAYAATLCYTLAGEALTVDLSVRNAGAVALPFGLGLHPWLPFPDDARLQARTDGVWLAGTRTTPPPDWQFATPAPLPAAGVDNVFDGWDGVAQITWPARRLALRIEADMDYLILYAPPGRDFFCVEPVDHPINAHALPGYPGLSVLAPGATLRRSCVFRGAAL